MLLLLLIGLVFAIHAVFAQNTTSADTQVIWCDKLWDNTGSVCPHFAVCVPHSKTGPNGEDAICSCEHFGTALVDKIERNSNNGELSLRCVASTASWVFFPVLILIALGGFAVGFKFLGVLLKAKQANRLRWDVMNVSVLLLSVGSISLGVSRVNHALAEIGVLNTSDTAFKIFEVCEAVTIVGMAVFGFGGALFFGVATLVMLEKSARLIGANAKGMAKSVKTGQIFAGVGGILCAIALIVVFRLGLYFLAGLIEAIGCLAVFVVFGLLARRLTMFLQSHATQAGTRVPTLIAVNNLAFRIRAILLVFLLTSTAIVVCTSVGRANVNAVLLGNTMVALSAVNFVCNLLIFAAMAITLDAVIQAKIRQDMSFSRSSNVHLKKNAVNRTTSQAVL